MFLKSNQIFSLQEWEALFEIVCARRDVRVNNFVDKLVAKA